MTLDRKVELLDADAVTRCAALESTDARVRTTALLQQRVSALTTEVQARQRSDDRLRRQVLANPLPTFIWERTQQPA